MLNGMPKWWNAKGSTTMQGPEYALIQFTNNLGADILEEVSILWVGG